jgi:putative SOS response-associated peptidase YedK
VCNLYSIMAGRAEIARLARSFKDLSSNQPPAGSVYPDYPAPIVVKGDDGGRELVDVRWGMPSSKKALLDAATKRADKLRAKGQDVDFQQLLRMEPDRGTTNVRNTSSSHWRPYLTPSNRCLVPVTSFSEPDQVGGSVKTIWFGLDQSQPLAFFAGVWTPSWTSVRKVKEGEVTTSLFAFLTTEANADVGAYHSKAMPVILTTEAERDLWMSDAPWGEVAHLQRPLPDGALQVVPAPTKTADAEVPLLI